jgi:hypothetical protein
VITVIAAGLASSRDSEGRFSFITMGFGAGQVGTSFPGWFYGVPVLIAVCALILVTGLSLVWLVRPGLASSVIERELDVAFRRAQTRSVLQLSGGTMAFTLGTLWMFVASASQLTAKILAVNGELTEVVSPFAALHVPLTVTGLLLGGAGLGLILAPAWSPLFRRAAVADAAMTPESKPVGR